MFSTEPQRFILSTRFESPDGRIYRLAQSVFVPGKRVVNGQDEPGQIEAIIIADVEGPEYNISPSKFTIPGFKDSERFNFIWGETKESITTDLE